MSGTRNSLAALVAAICTLFAALPAFAQCTKDTDCKGDRICDSGQCVGTALASPVAADPGWAGGAAIFGYTSAGLVFVLALASELTKAKSVPSIPLGSSAILVMAISNPIVAVGGGSARNSPLVKGLPLSRAASWVAYGGALLNGLVLIGLGLADIRPWTGLITATGALGAFALFMQANDAGASAKQARELSDGSSTRWRWRPTLVWGDDRQLGEYGLVGARLEY